MKGDEEIIKALNQCASGNETDIHKCTDCPLFGDYMTCIPKLIKGANDLVRRITARNERAKKENKKLKEKENGI